MLTRRRVVAARIETTEGTGVALVAADGGILAIEPRVDVDIRTVDRNPAMATLSKLASLRGAQSARITFRIEMKGAGSAYSATVLPALGRYLRACGFAETVVTTAGAETVTYRPASVGVPSLTIGCYEDGVVKRIIGARGNVRVVSRNGEPVFAEFDFLGVWDGVADGALLSPTYEGTVPPVLQSGLFTVAGYSAIISNFEIDIANTLALREDINRAAGFASTRIVDRKPAGRFDPEMTTIATHDWYGRWRAGVAGALNIGAIGAAQYNRVRIAAPRLVYTKVADADKEGSVIADTNFELAMNTGDDEIEIIFS